MNVECIACNGFVKTVDAFLKLLRCQDLAGGIQKCLKQQQLPS